MIHEKLVKKTTTLKTLDRIAGSEGHSDYFVIFEDRVRYCLKLDFATNNVGQPIGFFVRIRMVPDAKLDLYSMSNWFNQHFKAADVNKKLSTKFIKGQHLTIGSDRVSYVLTSEKTLDGYGDPTTQEGYEKLVKELTKDFENLGKRILRSMGIFCEPTDAVKKLVASSMADYLTMYAPAKPDAKKKAKGKKASVTVINAKNGAKGKGKIEGGKITADTTMKEAAEEILSDVCGEPMTIEFAEDTGEPKIKPKK